jgi:hypothetical protein
MSGYVIFCPAVNRTLSKGNGMAHGRHGLGKIEEQLAANPERKSQAGSHTDRRDYNIKVFS